MSLGGNKPQTLKKLLNELIDSKNWGEKLEEQRIPIIWDSVVGEQIAKVSKAVGFKDGVLTILTQSSTWRIELKLREKNLIEGINKELGNELVKQLQIK
jgi:predicted nucleic acid-binding Zn ribbon protein